MKTINYWIPLVDEFLTRKFTNQNISITTLRSYIHTFNSFLSSPYFDFNNFSTFSELNFLKYLWEEKILKNWKPNTYNNVRKYLKVFCDFLVDKWKLEFNPFYKIPKQRADQIKPRFFTKEELTAIFKSIEKNFEMEDWRHESVNFTLYYFLLFSWLRLSEVINLQINDISFEDNFIKVIQWKGRKDRIVVLHAELKKKLLKYLEFKKALYYKSNIMFCSYKGLKLKPRDINTIHDKIEKDTWIHITSHMFRHSFATELDGVETNVKHIAMMLWHSDTKTSERYIWANPHRVINDLKDKPLFEVLNGLQLCW